MKNGMALYLFWAKGLALQTSVADWKKVKTVLTMHSNMVIMALTQDVENRSIWPKERRKHMNNSEYSTQPEPTMKWHKFLIYFSLWAGALLSVTNGIQLLTGSHYGGNADQIYSAFSGLKAVDTIFGIINIAIAIYMIYVRFQLAGFKQGAPGKLTTLYVIQLVAYIAYSLVASGTTHISLSELIDSSMLSSLAISVVMIFVNRSYYDKRAHMFVN